MTAIASLAILVTAAASLLWQAHERVVAGHRPTSVAGDDD